MQAQRPPAAGSSEVIRLFFIVGFAILAIMVLVEFAAWSLFTQIATAFAKLG